MFFDFLCLIRKYSFIFVFFVDLLTIYLPVYDDPKGKALLSSVIIKGSVYPPLRSPSLPSTGKKLKTSVS